MKFLSFSKIFVLTGVFLAFSSCFKDLDTVPLDEDEFTSAVVYEDPGSYKKVLAKLYAGLAVTGQQGPNGQSDIAGIDEGFGQYMRMYWYLQELTTDEAVIGWNDATIKNFHNQNWDADDGFIFATYSRIFYQIALCNEFLRESTEGKLDSRGQSNLKGEIEAYRAEARFLRALSYYHALDLFRNVPFVTEEDAVGAFFPEQIEAHDLFHFIEEEMIAIEGSLLAPHSNEYGRADQAAAWTLLAKMYLNGAVYTGEDHYTECIGACQKVIASGYSLEPEYSHLFLADNDQTEGVIFPVTFDGNRTRTWGGTTFLVHAPVGGSMATADYGIDFGWGGLRTTSALVDKFPAVGGGSVLVAANPGSTGYPVIYAPGAHQNWDPASAPTLASVAGDGTYEGYVYFATDDNKFKFTPNPDWSADFGDTDADGTLDAAGTDITAGVAGLYKINVDLNALTYTLQRTDWGLIGDATGSWDVDQDMTYDVESASMSITLDLVPGKVKFRANDGWDLNYGDAGADALLEAGGADITIAGAGSYLIRLFLDKPDYTYSIEFSSFDSRALFYTDGQSKEINDLTLFTDGYAISKWRNVTSTGQAGKNEVHADTDFPMFRIEDVYLMYAEAVVRGGTGGDLTTALDLVNQVRARAYSGNSGNIAQAELTLDFLIDERARELYWEGHRRTDLVRFGRFSETSYVWPWKGGVKEGISTESCRDVFPIPSSDLGANPNLAQNHPECY